MSTLRDLRKRSYLTQEALARKAGIARETFSRYETGHRKPSERSTQMLAKLAEVLHVKLENIVFRKNQGSAVILRGKYRNFAKRAARVVCFHIKQCDS